MLRFKSSVRLSHVQAMAAILVVATQSYDEYDQDCTVTSAIDSKHGSGSLHYVGNAFDFRTRKIPEEIVEDICDLMTECLGRDFDVIVESDHIHVEWQPKTPVN